MFRGLKSSNLSSMTRRVVYCWLCGLGFIVSAAHAERMGAVEPRLAAEPLQPPSSWQTRRDYSRFPVSHAIALPVLAEAEAAARLEAAEPGAPLQIGFTRDLPEAYRGDLAKTARWSELPGGGQVASFSVRSADAEALRLAVRADLPDGTRVRFFEIGNPDGRYPIFKPGDFIRKSPNRSSTLTDDALRTRWSPVVSGDAIGVEIEIPTHAVPDDVSFRIVRASHISRSPMARATSDSSIRKRSATCDSIEVACKRLPSCPSSAVAVLNYTLEDGATYWCTGTAVNSKRSEMDNLDSPFFLTAQHCINSQNAADSVVTFWHYEYETCGGTSVHPDHTSLQGGAELMTSDPDSDGSLLRLRDALPNTACLAGWDGTGDWSAGTEVVSLHHPAENVKEWVGGSIEQYGLPEFDGGAVDSINVIWSEGSTRPGSSGAGLFTPDIDGDEMLIGLLTGGPTDDCSRDSYGRFDRFFGSHAGVHLIPANPPVADDHGGTAEAATGVLIGSVTGGRIDDAADADVFRVDIMEPGRLTVYTTGSLDTVGRLKREDGSNIELNDDGGFYRNFRIEAEVTAGTYYVKVTGFSHTQVGSYRLHVEFVAASAKKVLVPLFLSASALESTGRQGFVRVFNRSNRSDEVRISATDDSGVKPGTVTLSIDAFQTRPFNSEDLEQGNPDKGLSRGTGPGTGDWRLEFDSDLNVEVAAYVRTEDGFLTSMHDLATIEERTGAHHVPAFNPASNDKQRSRLRLINPDPDNAVEIVITGYDDHGSEGQSPVELRLLPGTARTLDALQLENGDANLTGRLGDGHGKWRLFIEAEGKIHVVSLLDSATGNLTNLSLPGGNNYRQ